MATLKDDEIKALIKVKPSFPNLEKLLKEQLKQPGIIAVNEVNKKNLDPNNSSVPPVPIPELKKNFSDLCKQSPLGENYTTGMFIELNALQDFISKIVAENSTIQDPDNKITHVHVGFGLRKARIIEDDNGKNMADWNCFHLIFQGANPNTEVVNGVAQKPTVVSPDKFSTYDGDEANYTGPKPGTPPFSDPEE